MWTRFSSRTLHTQVRGKGVRFSLTPPCLTTLTRREFHSRCVAETCKLDFVVPECVRFKRGFCPRCGTPMHMKPVASYTAHLEHHRLLNREAPPADGSTPLVTPKGLCALLEDIRSLENVGGIIRTCDGAGFSAVYLSGVTGTPLTGKMKLTKASLGSEDTVPWSYMQNTIECIHQLKKLGTKFIALEQTPNSTLLNATLPTIEASLVETNSICLVVGNEVEGLSEDTLSLADWVCHLPMKGNKKSLNVGVAFGIAAYLLSEKFVPEKVKPS